MKFERNFCKFSISQIDCVESLKLMKFWDKICKKENFGLSRFSGRVDCVEISILYENEEKTREMNFLMFLEKICMDESWLSVSFHDCVES